MCPKCQGLATDILSKSLAVKWLRDVTAGDPDIADAGWRHKRNRWALTAGQHPGEVRWGVVSRSRPLEEGG